MDILTRNKKQIDRKMKLFYIKQKTIISYGSKLIELNKKNSKRILFPAQEL